MKTKSKQNQGLFFRLIKYALISISLLFFSCKKKETANPNNSNNNTANPYAKGVWILNQGDFMHSDASVSFYHTDNGNLESNVFAAKNNNRPLGDVLQSMFHYNGKYYLVVNNSRKIEVVGDRDFKTVNEITNLTLPRYFLPVSDAKAYVTDESAKGVWVVNPTTGAMIKKISLDISGDNIGWTEEMALSGNKLYVTDLGANDVIVINTDNDNVTDTIHVGIQPQWLAMDKEGKLWVLCNAAYPAKKPSSIQRIDLQTNKVILNMEFSDSTAYPTQLKINVSGDTLYYLNGGVYRMPITASTLPSMPAIQPITSGTHAFYGLGISPDRRIYVGDATNFTGNGAVYIYDGQGNQLKNFTVGIGPCDFLFTP